MKKRLLLSLILFASSVSQASSCADAFSNSYSLSSQRAKVRVAAVIEHQNKLRASKGLPELKVSGPSDEYAERIHILGEERDADFSVTTSSFPDEPISASLKIVNQTVVRDQYNDLFSLNFVYEFANDKITVARPFVVWFLAKQPAEITLYRKMSSAEFEIWKRHEMQSLGREWGHTGAHGESVKVVHFSTSAQFTSAAAGRSDPLIAVRFRREDLLNWYSSKSMLWAGSLDAESGAVEIVMPVELLGALDKSKPLVVILPD